MNGQDRQGIGKGTRTKIINSATCKLGQLDTSWDGVIRNPKTYDSSAESSEFAGK